MNWYKKARIVDDSPQTEVARYVVCPSCGSWATNRSGKPQEDFEWKFYYQMDPDEQLEIDIAKKNFDVGLVTYEIQHCPDCMERR